MVFSVIDTLDECKFVLINAGKFGQTQIILFDVLCVLVIRSLLYLEIAFKRGL